LNPPYADWLLKGLRRIEPQMLNGTPPLVDELLIYEYARFGGH
jgi:hypothetical protein